MKEERWGAIKQDRRRTHTYYGQEKKENKEEFIHLGPIEIILFHKFNVSSCEVHRYVRVGQLKNFGVSMEFCLKTKSLTLIGMREGTFHPSVLFGPDFVS